MNLVQQVGAEYFSSRFGGCIFVGPNDKPHYIEGVSVRRTVNCKEAESHKQLKNVELPFDFFSTFKFLAVPELGWRSADDGRVLLRYSRDNKSYTRGITLKNVSREYAEHTEYMFGMGKLNKKDIEAPSFIASTVVQPEHLSMSDGVEAMKNGKIMAFTNSASVAVVPESDSLFNIYCGSTHVANTTPEGEITLVSGCEDFDLETLQ